MQSRDLFPICDVCPQKKCRRTKELWSVSYSRCNKKAKTDGIVIEPEGQSIGAVLSAKQ